MSLDSMADILHCMEQEGKEFWEVVLAADMEERQVSRESSLAKMLTTWQAMVDASDSYTGDRRSVSGLVGGDGLKMRQYAIRGKAMSGGYVSEVIAEALSMAESNACMRRIVAAPTAGCTLISMPQFSTSPSSSSTRWAAPPRKRFCRLCIPLPASAQWSASGPVSPVLPAAVRLRSAPPAPWRRGLWWPSGAAAASRSATPWPWP